MEGVLSRDIEFMGRIQVEDVPSQIQLYHTPFGLQAHHILAGFMTPILG